ncbi:Spy0128 family protein [Collinsella aerofaciens]|uniref:Spy0128 family protein n=1 Tax=Collinsella aerofaciens TaxID=74426 RepID=UPI0029146878|nr:FctA domain-containing protein [Collinsella aerofaciens]MDU8610093.1 FctA domain-containing protein [Collinsella aerofaciens]
MKANSDKYKQSNKATRRVLAGVLCGASVLSLVLSLVMPPISQAIANDAQTVSTEETVMGGGSSSGSTDVDNTNNGDTENQNSDDAEGGESGDDALGTPPLSDDTGAESAAQPADDGQSVYKAATVANEGEVPGLQRDKDGYTLLTSDGDLTTYLNAPTKPDKLRLAADISSSESITIRQNTTIDLANHKLYYSSGNSDKGTSDPVRAFITISNGSTLTVEGTAEDLQTEATSSEPGQPAMMQLSGSVPQSLTYYVTESTPNGFGTSETTYQHTVADFGAIVACKEGYVNRVISVEEGGTLNLKGGMITTPRTLGSDGHVILSQGAVNISGGYVTNGNGGGWGGGLCITGANASLEMTDGVVAGNKAASGGGVYADNGATLKLTGGIISGNATYGEADGLGGGILASGGSVTVSGGYITNNKYAKYCGNDGQGDHGGAGLAANNGAHVAISGGQITGNYSEEAGGGVYVTNIFHSGMAWLDITGGNIASNVSYKSEGAGIRVGQKVDAMISGASKDSPVYITNNHCMSRFDWGGGGVFVQGDSDNDASNAGRLFVYSSYISSNTAGGYGGGVAVCPTGKTLVTNTEGTAIFGNTDAQNADSYDENDNDNNGNPHLSGGGHKKTQDKYAYNSVDKNGEHVFRDSGHADFFLAAEGHITPVAVVTGKMLGDIDAKYSGSIELTDRITIPANGAAQIKNSIGLTSGVSATDKTATEAVQKNATTFITGNYSWNHGGGIMSNGDLYLGQPADTYVYPSLKLKATKALSGRKINNGEFSFTVYRKDSVDPFASGVFNHDVCTPVGTASNVDGGNITFNLGEQSAANGTAGTITYYLVENAGKVSGITYDPAVYEIKVTVEDHPTVLMTVPTRDDPNKTIELKIHNYKIKDVSAVEHPKGETDSQNVSVKPDATEGYYSIDGPDGGKTFTNKYTPSVSWTPMATKIVEGGEMKKFTLQLATDSRFRDTDIIGTAETTSGKDTKQTLSFKDATDKDKTIEFKYSLSDIRNNSDDPGGSTGGSFKTFTYYVREKTDGSQFSHYTYDQSVYKFTVVPTYDTEKGEINCAVTYRKGTVDKEGTWVSAETEGHEFPDTIPTFTNTYSTSLPLSGMSGVTLTYLAGAAVLCAAAAWMHIRRKANAKGGERRE